MSVTFLFCVETTKYVIEVLYTALSFCVQYFRYFQYVISHIRQIGIFSLAIHHRLTNQPALYPYNSLAGTLWTHFIDNHSHQIFPDNRCLSSVHYLRQGRYVIVVVCLSVC